jgi:hypothetical protein
VYEKVSVSGKKLSEGCFYIKEALYLLPEKMEMHKNIGVPMCLKNIETRNCMGVPLKTLEDPGRAP